MLGGGGDVVCGERGDERRDGLGGGRAFAGDGGVGAGGGVGGDGEELLDWVCLARVEGSWSVRGDRGGEGEEGKDVEDRKQHRMGVY